MSFFQDLGVFIHNYPETEAKRSYAHAALNYKTISVRGFMSYDRTYKHTNIYYYFLYINIEVNLNERIHSIGFP